MSAVIEGGAATAALLSTIRDLGRTLDDIERARIQVGNRISAITKDRRDEDIHDRELPPGISDAYLLLAGGKDEEEKRVVGVEELIEKELERAWKQHPLYQWSRHVQGVGEKVIARLVAEIGDPLLRPVGHFEEPDNAKRKFVVDSYEPRTLSQLNAYCGHGDPRRRRRQKRLNAQGEPVGMSQDEAQALGNPIAKKRLYLVALSGTKQLCPACAANSVRVKVERKAAGMSEADVKRYIPPAAEGCTCEATHPLRFAYDSARARYATRLNEQGANLGEPWTDKHVQTAAYRFTGKVFLRMLWEAAQDPEAAAAEMKERKTATASAPAPDGAMSYAPSRNGTSGESS